MVLTDTDLLDQWRLAYHQGVLGIDLLMAGETPRSSDQSPVPQRVAAAYQLGSLHRQWATPKRPNKMVSHDPA